MLTCFVGISIGALAQRLQLARDKNPPRDSKRPTHENQHRELPETFYRIDCDIHCAFDERPRQRGRTPRPRRIEERCHLPGGTGPANRPELPLACLSHTFGGVASPRRVARRARRDIRGPYAHRTATSRAVNWINQPPIVGFRRRAAARSGRPPSVNFIRAGGEARATPLDSGRSAPVVV